MRANLHTGTPTCNNEGTRKHAHFTGGSGFSLHSTFTDACSHVLTVASTHATYLVLIHWGRPRNKTGFRFIALNFRAVPVRLSLSRSHSLLFLSCYNLPQSSQTSVLLQPVTVSQPSRSCVFVKITFFHS